MPTLNLDFLKIGYVILVARRKFAIGEFQGIFALEVV